MPENSGFFGGRGSVSKTVGRGFETFFPCHAGVKFSLLRRFGVNALFIVFCGFLKALKSSDFKAFWCL